MKTSSDICPPRRWQAVLTERRRLKMACSAHSYVRGSTLKFYEWLGSSTARSLPQGPPVWICGDCHLGNLGPVADAKGRLKIAISDLDQTVIGNPAHDLIRLGLSLATAIRGSDLPGVTTALMLEQMMEGYEGALANPGKNPRKSAAPASVHNTTCLGLLKSATSFCRNSTNWTNKFARKFSLTRACFSNSGRNLGRPRVDTLEDSRQTNMKELRFDGADGVWRVAFAFDPMRKAILLVAGDKSGLSQSKFYKRLIAKADDRFDAHLARLKQKERRRGSKHAPERERHYQASQPGSP